MRSFVYPQRLRRQRGAVLVVSLILLVLMTIIGVTAMRANTLQEKMTGNMRDYSLAFQSAESALREGESRLQAPPPRPSIENAGAALWVWGLNKLHPNATGPTAKPGFNPDETSSWWTGLKPWWESYLRDANWWKDNSKSHSYPITGLLSEVATLPRYLIEQQAYVRDHVGISDYSTPETGRDYYRITAWAEGGESGGSTVLLQSVFAWRYD